MRSQSGAALEAWKRACKEFHGRYNELFYPGGLARWKAYLNGEMCESDTAIEILDPGVSYFRSGYLKEDIWRKMKRAPLSSKQLRRLESIALEYLPCRLRREFWSMARFAVFRGSDAFWEQVKALAENPQVFGAEKAGWLLVARSGRDVRRMVYHEFVRAKYQSGYTPSFSFYRLQS